MAKLPFILGITGGSASGKSSFLNELKASLKNNFTTISQDNYYFRREHQPIDSKGIPNFDTPQSIDVKAFLEDVKSLAQGKSFFREEYTYNNPLVKPQLLEYQPAPLLIVEGLFLLNNPEIRSLLNLAVYIEAEEHLKLKRRILRDKIERGYDLEDVLYRYEHHVFPCYENHIRPYKKFADLIIPNYDNFEKGLDVVRLYLSTKIDFEAAS